MTAKYAYFLSNLHDISITADEAVTLIMSKWKDGPVIRTIRSMTVVAGFAVAFAWVEAAVVVYLRDVYYPEGFSFPLSTIGQSRLIIELIREVATLLMLGAVGMLAGKTRWQRFAHFAITFGVWDIFFYLWLKVMIGWPDTIFDWDILFLLPVPWIGPVIAPVAVSCVLIVGGWMILRVEKFGTFRAPASAWVLSFVASGTVLWTFMRDMNAGLHGAMPEPFRYDVFVAGLLLYGAAIVQCWRTKKNDTIVSERSE